MSSPFISIIVPAKNTQATIAKCVNSLQNLNYKDYEIIIINDGSSDDTSKMLNNFNNIKVIKTEGIGPSRCRNMAIAQAKGEFIAFTDGDCIVDKEWLNELLKGFADANIVGVGGSQESPEDESRFGRNVHEFFKSVGFIEYIKSDTHLRQTKHNPTCNAMYQKSVLQEIGGFLEGLWPGEDVELDYRIIKKGYELMYNPKAIIYHYRPNSLKKFCSMMYKYGWAQGVLVRRYGFFRRIHSEPFLIIVLFLIGVIIFRACPIFLSCYFMFLLIMAIIFFLTKPLKLINIKLFLKLFYFTIVLWNLGFLMGIFGKIKNIPCE